LTKKDATKDESGFSPDHKGDSNDKQFEKKLEMEKDCQKLRGFASQQFVDSLGEITKG